MALVELEANSDGSKALVGAVIPGPKGPMGGADPKNPGGGGGGGGRGPSEKAVTALVAALGMDRDQVRALLEKLPDHLKKVCLEAANNPQQRCSRSNCPFRPYQGQAQRGQAAHGPLLR